MTPQAYCARLEQALSSMPPAERQEIIRYYLEFLEDASEDERSALGTPEELAQRILRENGIFPPDTAAAPPKKNSNRIAKWIILACTCYIWIPLLTTWYSLLLTALIVLAVIPIALCAALLGGLFTFVLALFQDVPSALMQLGMGTCLRRRRCPGRLSHLDRLQKHCKIRPVHHKKDVALRHEGRRYPMKKRCILIGAVYGLVLLGWGITGTFSPAAPTRSEQSDNAVPVETIQLEQLRICPGNTFSVRTSQPLSASRNGSVLSLRRQWQLFQRHSENDITITLPAAQFAQLEQAVNTTKRSDQK